MLDPGTLGSSVTDVEKKEIQESTFSIIVLCLADNVLRRIDREKTAFGVWKRLEEFFMTKSLTNRIMLKEKFFRFHMDASKSLE